MCSCSTDMYKCYTRFTYAGGSSLISRLLLLSLAFLPLTLAQEFRASISGEITDSTGAPVPGVRVLVTNVATNLVSEGTSNESGRYNVNFLQPGTYTLSVEKAGFKKFL